MIFQNYQKLVINLCWVKTFNKYHKASNWFTT